MKFTNIIFATFALLAFTPFSTYGQTSQSIGMHHRKMWSPPPAETPPPADKTETDELIEPKYEPLQPKDALVEIDNLEVWSHLDEAALARSNDDIKNLIHLIESDRGAVSPQGLFFAAKSLSDRHLMEQASVYYLVGQLRLAFDIERWPARANKDDLARKAEDENKSEDQAAPNRDVSPRIDDPHQGIKSLAKAIGEPVVAWMLKNPTKMDNLLNQARIWDASAPYAYLPDYDLTEPIPFDKWERTLKSVREVYFAQMMSVSKVMRKVKD